MLLGLLEIFPFTWLLALCPLTCWCPICWSDFSFYSLGGFLNCCSGCNLGILGPICSPFSCINIGYIGAICNPFSCINFGSGGGAIGNPCSCVNYGAVGGAIGNPCSFVNAGGLGGAIGNPCSFVNVGFLGAICNPCVAFNLEGWCCSPWGICPICWPFNLADQCFWPAFPCWILISPCLIGALPCGGTITLLTFIGDQFLFEGEITTTVMDFLFGESGLLSSVCENCSSSFLS